MKVVAAKQAHLRLRLVWCRDRQLQSPIYTWHWGGLVQVFDGDVLFKRRKALFKMLAQFIGRELFRNGNDENSGKFRLENGLGYVLDIAVMFE